MELILKRIAKKKNIPSDDCIFWAMRIWKWVSTTVESR